MLSGGERRELDGRLRDVGIDKMGHRCAVLAALPQLGAAASQAERAAQLRLAGVAKMGHRFAVLRLLTEMGHIRPETSPVSVAGASEMAEVLGAGAALAPAPSADDETGCAPPATGTSEAAAAAGDAAPPAVLSPGAVPLFFVVAHAPLVFVREAPDGDSRKLGYKWRGERLAVAEVRGLWVRLADEEGWMMHDGSGLGLGQLLRRLPPAVRALPAPAGETGLQVFNEEEEAVSVSELLMRQLFEQKFPKSTPRPEAGLAVEGEGLADNVRRGIDKVHLGYDRARLSHRLRHWPPSGPPGSPRVPAPIAEAPAAEPGAPASGTAALLDRFVKQNEPLLLRGALAGWAPFHKWDVGYLRAAAGGRTVPVRLRPRVRSAGRVFGDPLRMQAYESGQATLGQVLDELSQPEPSCYAARMPLATLLPELMPDTAGGPADYFCSSFGSAHAINPVVYLGGGRQATPMHFDPSDNLFCMVQGAKTVTLFHPADTPNLYPAGQRNTTAVYSLVDAPDAADTERFPALADARPRVAEVRAGDVLYLPCGWWHAVRGSEGTNLSVNYWFELHADKADPGVLMDGLVAKAARDAREQGIRVTGQQHGGEGGLEVARVALPLS